MTKNKHWLYLEELRKSGKTNMFLADSYLVERFNLTPQEAKHILFEWMSLYNRADYE